MVLTCSRYYHATIFSHKRTVDAVVEAAILGLNLEEQI
jgi:hypothetical protein